MQLHWCIIIVTVPLLTLAQGLMVVAAPPATEQRPVTDTYHGETVTDPYRWLEDWTDGAVQAWTEEQNQHARTYLDSLPNAEKLRERVREVMTEPTVKYDGVVYQGDRFFALKNVPPQEQPVLVVMDALAGADDARVLLDPSQAEGGVAAIDWFEPSPDGKLVAVSMSRGGDEVGDVSVYDVETGQRVHEIVPRVNSGTAGGDLAWAPDRKGFYYTRHPRPGERPDEDLGFYQQVYFHPLGGNVDQDRFELGEGFPRIAEIELETNNQSGQVLATVQNGDGGEFAHYLRMTDGKWKQFSRFDDKTIQATFDSRGDILTVSRLDAPRGRIMRLRVADIDQGVKTELIPEGKGTIVTSFYHSPPTVVSLGERIYVVYQFGGPSEIRVFDSNGKEIEGPKLLPVSSVDGLCPISENRLLFRNESYIAPAAYYVYDVTQNTVTKTPLHTEAEAELTGVNVVREFAKSKDGTLIPVNIVFPRDIKLDGSTPTLLTGYGGYGINLVPRYVGVRRILLEHGMVLAVANLRGGGEYGEQWHDQGRLTMKQNVFDDFAAAAEHLIERHYTSPEKLALIGGSNGGLLMGATLTQRPDLAKAVVSLVGIYDMLRVELSPNGAFNVPEFGSVKNPEQYKALRAYSPYHHVQDGQKYPATLFLTGVNDPRVDPMQSRKMTARMQAAVGDASPVLLRTSSNTGHGGDTPLSERIEETVSIFSFLLNELGVDVD
jgi:prolyl oligopeptidase